MLARVGYLFGLTPTRETQQRDGQSPPSDFAGRNREEAEPTNEPSEIGSDSAPSISSYFTKFNYLERKRDPDETDRRPPGSPRDDEDEDEDEEAGAESDESTSDGSDVPTSVGSRTVQLISDDEAAVSEEEAGDRSDIEENEGDDREKVQFEGSIGSQPAQVHSTVITSRVTDRILDILPFHRLTIDESSERRPPESISPRRGSRRDWSSFGEDAVEENSSEEEDFPRSTIKNRRKFVVSDDEDDSFESADEDDGRGKDVDDDRIENGEGEEREEGEEECEEEGGEVEGEGEEGDRYEKDDDTHRRVRNVDDDRPFVTMKAKLLPNSVPDIFEKITDTSANSLQTSDREQLFRKESDDREDHARVTEVEGSFYRFSRRNDVDALVQQHLTVTKSPLSRSRNLSGNSSDDPSEPSATDITGSIRQGEENSHLSTAEVGRTKRVYFQEPATPLVEDADGTEGEDLCRDERSDYEETDDDEERPSPVHLSVRKPTRHGTVVVSSDEETDDANDDGDQGRFQHSTNDTDDRCEESSANTATSCNPPRSQHPEEPLSPLHLSVRKPTRNRQVVASSDEESDDANDDEDHNRFQHSTNNTGDRYEESSATTAASCNPPRSQHHEEPLSPLHLSVRKPTRNRTVVESSDEESSDANDDGYHKSSQYSAPNNGDEYKKSLTETSAPCTSPDMIHLEELPSPLHMSVRKPNRNRTVVVSSDEELSDANGDNDDNHIQHLSNNIEAASLERSSPETSAPYTPPHTLNFETSENHRTSKDLLTLDIRTPAVSFHDGNPDGDHATSTIDILEINQDTLAVYDESDASEGPPSPVHMSVRKPNKNHIMILSSDDEDVITTRRDVIEEDGGEQWDEENDDNAFDVPDSPLNDEDFSRGKGFLIFEGTPKAKPVPKIPSPTSSSSTSSNTPGPTPRVLFPSKTPARKPLLDRNFRSVDSPNVKSSRAFAREKSELTRRLFAEYNERVFEGKLPDDLEVSWNVKLTTTAGRAHEIRSWIDEEWIYKSKIELSTKVIDNEEKLRNTLAHEMCHVAAWLINHIGKPPHGPVFKAWANRVMKFYPTLNITTCHAYEIEFKFKFECLKCGKIYGRHSNSIDTEAKACGICRGRLQLQQRLKKDGTPMKTRTNKFANFVKEHFKTIRDLHPGKSHSEIMSLVSIEYKRKQAQATSNLAQSVNLEDIETSLASMRV